MTSKKDKTIGDQNWELLFKKYNILEKIKETGHFIITSQQINEFRESRLMTKFDHKNNLPLIFQVNRLSILPLTRGSYIIARFEAYQTVEYSKDIKSISVPKRYDLESIDYNNIYSESAALNCAFVSGIIQDVLEEKCELTVNGRMSSKNFEFCIKESESPYDEKKIKVENSQCEIDGGFESETKLALIEAKNIKCEDFLIRQIYYPYRLWKERVSKKVVPIFMTYSNDKFSFFIYEFNKDDSYNSLKLIEQKDYVMAPEPINLEDIKEILSKVGIKPELNVPFPQANNFSRVVDLLGLLVENELSNEEITSKYDFDKRQTEYYFNAGKYIGLIDKFKDADRGLVVRLTEKGREIMSFPHKDKNLEFVRCILEHRTFKESLELYFKKLERPSKDEIVEIMKRDNLQGVGSDETYGRRAQTVLKWIDWILDLVDD